MKESYNRFMSGFFDHNGRITRKDYWIMKAILVLLFGALLFVLCEVVDIETLKGAYTVALFIYIYLLISLVATGKRLHDRGISAHHLFFNLLFPVGPFYILVMCLLKGTEGNNKFGENPYDLTEPKPIEIVSRIKYCVTKGTRLGRGDYWFICLSVGVVLFAIRILFMDGSIQITDTTGIGQDGVASLISYYGQVLIMGIFVYKRLQDANLPGPLVFIQIIPICRIAIFFMTCVKGYEGENQYGPDPMKKEEPVFANPYETEQEYRDDFWK